MMKYIIPLLLLTCGLSAQTKWRQIERSAVKWRVPAAYDSIPGQTGYASKYIDFTTLMDTVGVTSFAIDSLDYRNDSLLIWVGGGYYFAIIPQGASGSGGDGEVAYWMQDTLAGDTVHFWDVSNKRLGLNTKTPAALLHVKKNEYALPVAQFENPGTNGQTVLIKHGASSDARYTLTLQTPAATTYFDARGYMGLGISPSYPIHVYGSNGISRFENTNTNGDAGLDFKNGSKQWRVAMNAEGGSTNNLHFRDVTGSRYPLTLQSSNGYVGILNLTPARELHVTGRVRVSTLDSDLTPPTTAGTTKMVITDEDGDLSFATIPTIPADSTVVTQGYGITVAESPTNTYNVKADTSALVTQYDLTASNQKLSHSSTATTHTTTLSNAGGSLVLKEGSNVTLTTSGNEVTIAATGSGGGIDSTIIIGGWGIESTESPANTFNLIADSTQVASQYDLTLKQDKLTNPVTGTGTTNYVSKFTGTSTVGNSQIQDNGSTVGIGALNASYKFYVNSGNMKLGENATANSLNKLYFGDGTFVYVGEDVADNRLYLRGGSLAVNINGSLGTAGQVLKSSGSSTVTWQSDADTDQQNLTYTSSTGLMEITNGTSATIPLATTSARGLLPTLSNSSTQFLNGLGNWATPSGVVTNLSYANTTSPVTLNSSTGTDVTFTAGSGITLSVTGSNMTITGSGGGTTNLSYGALNNGGAPSSYGDYVMIDNSSGADINITDGDGIDIERHSSNFAGYKLNQSYANLIRTTNTGVAITSTETAVDFTGGFENGNMTYSTVNDNITLTQAGTYDIEFSTTVYTTGTTTRRVEFTMYNSTNALPDVINIIQDVDAVKYETMSRSRVYVSNAGSTISIKTKYDSAVGSGTDIYYRYPSLKITRLK